MKRNNKAVIFLKQKSYLLAAVLMLAAIFGMTGVYVAEQREEKQQQLAQEQEQQRALEQQKELAKKQTETQEESEIKAVDQVILPQNDDFLDEPEEVISSKDEKESEDETANEEAVQETASMPQQPEIHFDAATEMLWPLEGNVIMNYSMDQTVYFATLKQYKCNPAIVIQGKVNDKVLSVADGIVSNIEKDPVTGYTVTVDLGDGYSALYGQLKEIPLSAGDYIEAGAIVGYVSEPTKYYIEEGPNLYFQMIKDNESIDPMEYLQ